MKQLIGLTGLGALTAAPETVATQALDRRLPQEGELVLLGIDGTIVAREINLTPHAGHSRACSEQNSASACGDHRFCALDYDRRLRHGPVRAPRVPRAAKL